VEVIADDEVGSRSGDVIASVYFPPRERKKENVDYNSAEIIYPMHLVVIISPEGRDDKLGFFVLLSPR
jgi:hypothetical protein